ncbi:hypothetical protein EYZ11_002196 [Aspergillus tanneri]|uniref:Uncharacterized protein n=1 Tax=Aspergillus tanneri TaxID=1220188 RepID=A0A4S3JRU8_9EURO|nr:uncharacterized protein ATNIH1004_008975 [Aspergillus tanneri]KAA8644767.1 hypothetical protein ATNIH1004_008975 [Aspergillus tanneri]THC98335.1 hypothetical protein EYZ11_002196 [Aspergillus tanneri]
MQLLHRTLVHYLLILRCSAGPIASVPKIRDLDLELYESNSTPRLQPSSFVPHNRQAEASVNVGEGLTVIPITPSMDGALPRSTSTMRSPSFVAIPASKSTSSSSPDVGLLSMAHASEGSTVSVSSPPTTPRQERPTGSSSHAAFGSSITVHLHFTPDQDHPSTSRSSHSSSSVVVHSHKAERTIAITPSSSKTPLSTTTSSLAVGTIGLLPGVESSSSPSRAPSETTSSHTNNGHDSSKPTQPTVFKTTTSKSPPHQTPVPLIGDGVPVSPKYTSDSRNIAPTDNKTAPFIGDGIPIHSPTTTSTSTTSKPPPITVSNPVIVVVAPDDSTIYTTFTPKGNKPPSDPSSILKHPGLPPMHHTTTIPADSEPISTVHATSTSIKTVVIVIHDPTPAEGSHPTTATTHEAVEKGTKAHNPSVAAVSHTHPPSDVAADPHLLSVVPITPAGFVTITETMTEWKTRIVTKTETETETMTMVMTESTVLGPMTMSLID